MKANIRPLSFSDSFSLFRSLARRQTRRVIKIRAFKSELLVEEKRDSVCPEMDFFRLGDGCGTQIEIKVQTRMTSFHGKKKITLTLT